MTVKISSKPRVVNSGKKTGHAVPDAGPWVAARKFTMQLPDGSYVVADERFFLLRVHSDAVSRQGWTPSENRFITDLRWWTLNERSTTSETVFSENLLDIFVVAGVT
jgi:8-oxo-dGTP diphosphatase